jgi:3-hydroxyisobutyrate dehydrogenase-like beta-hydroxyacid dehydrogenase
MTVVGFAGLGTMGGRMADRLLRSGYTVHGWNRTRAKAAPLRERGLMVYETAREAAEAVDVVFTSLTGDEALEAVASGPTGVLAGLAPGQIWVDTSTVSPRASEALARRVAAAGAEFLDAPVSGSVPQADAGQLTIMVGGSKDAYARAEPILRALGTPTHVGENGRGLVLKLAINISLAAQMLAFSEGVLLAERGGIDRDVAMGVMTESAIGSPMLKARRSLLLALPESAWFDIGLMQKDIVLALELARGLHVPLPSAEVADELLTVARAMGYGRRDLAALFEVLGRLAGEPVAAV